MSYITGLICLVLSLLVGVAFARPECVLFMYHHKTLPLDLLHTYDWIVLDADTPFMDRIRVHFYLKRRAKLIGYMSVGEIEKYRDYYPKLKRFSLGKNPMWDSEVADIRQEEYLEFLLDVVASRIADKGFDGFLLDTLDSYRLVAEKEDYKEFESALEKFIKELKRRYPDKMIVLNRGFEVIPRVREFVDGVVVESLFWGIDQNRNYREVPEEDRKHLLTILNGIKGTGLPVVVIDYLDPKEREKAQELVSKISALGFIPYVSDKELSRVGHSTCRAVPRRIVLLYNSKLFKKIHEADIHRLVQMPLEYLGFVPELYDISDGLPEIYPELGYAGVISLYLGETNRELEEWLIKVKEEGVKLFFIDSLPFTNGGEAYREFGINRDDSLDDSYNLVHAREGHGYEAPLVFTDIQDLLLPKNGKAVVKVINSVGQEHVPFAITPWGGYAVDGTLLNENELWVYDPFLVFRWVFGGGFPVPDVTTENGRRILTAHIDGDAFFGDSEVDQSKANGEVIRDEIIRKFPIPHTVSIVEAEVAPWGLYPNRSERLEDVARSIFSLPNVEAASHSFSHPFTWQPDKTPKEDLIYGYHLPVEGYSFDLYREIEGSLDYVNSLAFGVGKRAEVFLWTGDCDPAREQVRATYRAHVLNVNGGDTTATYSEPFLSKVSPMGVNYGDLFQVYAPVQNENLYTNLWTEPKWGYINVIQTFKLTEKPRRLKPISIYYHFYSGQTFASLNALKEVYSYAISQPTTPMFLSQYALRVLDFRNTSIMRTDRGFKIRNSGYLRTLRVEKDTGYPDIKNSKGVIGYTEEGENLYIHLDGSGDYEVVFSKKPSPWFRIVSTNALVKHYERNGNEIHISLESYTPISLTLDTGGCRVSVNGKEISTGRISLEGGLNAEIKATCPR